MSKELSKLFSLIIIIQAESSWPLDERDEGREQETPSEPGESRWGAQGLTSTVAQSVSLFPSPESSS